MFILTFRDISVLIIVTPYRPNHHYSLQGTAPWTVTYAFNGKTSTANVNTRHFSRVAEKAGTLEVRSVAHQHNSCKRDLSPTDEGMRKVIHPLPSVKVRDGANFIEDLREGTQAEIVFSLRGTPPFSLTYQRLEAADFYAYPRVLEEHTISGILEDEVRFFASEEGTWKVTWLQDRYCSVSIDGKGQKTGQGRAKLAIMEG
jgi:nucleoporin POM152